MAFKYVPVAALALAIVCSQPIKSEPDRHENTQNEPHPARLESEATDPIQMLRSSEHKKETKPDDAHDMDNSRPKRAFALWTGRHPQLEAYQSFSMWKPSAYQLSRPYFIPVFGAPGRLPIFFPPQRLHQNPGVPLDNPLPNMPFRGPAYLPPKEYLPPTSTTEKPMKIGDRFDDDDDDDRPIWSGSAPSTERPSNVIPTRPPRPPGMTEFPPLVHDINSEGNSLNVDESSKENSVVPAGDPTNERPPQTGPSTCTWAIVSCCSAASNAVPDNCFEQRGCPGPFWGASPCDSEYAKKAIEAALNYFNE